MHIQEFADGKNAGDGTDTHKELNAIRTVEHYMPGNSEKQHVQSAASVFLRDFSFLDPSPTPPVSSADH